MENLAGPRLLQAFFEYATDVALSSMDNATKAALRLSCKNAKAFVDATVTAARGGTNTLETILSCDWQLSELYIEGGYQQYEPFTKNDFTSLSALCSKFPTLQVLDICSTRYLHHLPENIGQLSKLVTLKLMYANVPDLPASFGQLSSLERLELRAASDSSQPTIEGLAPLKQLTQLKYLRMAGSLVSKHVFPTWLGNMFLPESFADLVLDRPAEECSLELVAFNGNTSVVHGPRVDLAFNLLWERRVLSY
jgi:hypothetical protein